MVRLVPARRGADVARVRRDGEQAAAKLRDHQVRARRAAADHAGGVGRAQGRRRLAGRGVLLGVLGVTGRAVAVRRVAVDPDLRLNAAHAVDEQQRVGDRACDVRVDRPPAVHGYLHAGVDPRGGLRELPFQLKAGAVAGIPAVDAEAHAAPARSLRGGNLGPLGHGCSVSVAARPSRAMSDVRALRVTRNRTGTRSASSATWVTTPTIRSPWASDSSVAATISRVSASRVPNPSSRKIESSRAAPAAARAEICDDRASARASDAWKVSPPDKVLTERVASASAWSMTNNSPLSWVRSNWPPDSVARVCEATATSSSSASLTSHCGNC